MNHSFIVEELKTRLDKFLVSQLPQVSRSQIQRDIESGLVEINGEKVMVSKFVVRLNDAVMYHQPEHVDESLKPSNTPLKVLYNDHDLLIIDKPAGMAVHPGAGFKGETLVSALLYHFSAKGGSAFGGKDIQEVGEDHRPGIVHRLDKDTSGVILVAKTSEMYEFLKDAFAERKIKKEYIALVYGKLEKNHGFIESPIGRSKSDFRKYSTKNMVEPKESLTEYQVLEHLQEKATLDEYTLILVKLHTGRTHQIRVHFASLGFPLVGDSLYGNKKSQRKDLHRQFLHAKRIEVQLPDKTWIEAESEFPDDLKEVLSNLDSKSVKNL
jgi:23S rRNA pseudouridine1911/1915/1917 synthase